MLGHVQEVQNQWCLLLREHCSCALLLRLFGSINILCACQFYAAFCDSLARFDQALYSFNAYTVFFLLIWMLPFRIFYDTNIYAQNSFFCGIIWINIIWPYPILVFSVLSVRFITFHISYLSHCGRSGGGFNTFNTTPKILIPFPVRLTILPILKITLYEWHIYMPWVSTPQKARPDYIRSLGIEILRFYLKDKKWQYF